MLGYTQSKYSLFTNVFLKRYTITVLQVTTRMSLCISYEISNIICFCSMNHITVVIENNFFLYKITYFLHSVSVQTIKFPHSFRFRPMAGFSWLRKQQANISYSKLLTLNQDCLPKATEYLFVFLHDDQKCSAATLFTLE